MAETSKEKKRKNFYMKHITIDYGIDLGTTNSAICRIEEGVPVMVESDSGADTMPSCISFKKSGALTVGHAAYSELGRSKLRALKKREGASSNSCIEFKRFMGSDKTYANANAERAWTPEELSAQVLQALCSFVTDEEVKAAVITVPAKFTVNQKDATLEAAHLAGLEQVELIQEPIAASMAYGLKAGEKEGVWMVFDLGGGTLDVALVHVEDGIMQVFDTEGDNYLGGKNLDEAIVSKILMPELLKRHALDTADAEYMSLLTEALKVEAEKLKNSLSYKEVATVTLEAGDWGEDEDGEEIEMELDVSRERLEYAMRPVLQKAVDVCKTILIRNNIGFGRLTSLILIGGPTKIPLLRRMLEEQVTPEVATGVDPMTAVAQGAALYAATIPLRNRGEAQEDGTDSLELAVEFEPNTVDEESYVTVHAREDVAGLEVKLTRTEDGWETPTVAVPSAGALLIAELLPGRPNRFAVTAYIDGKERRCSPSELTILHGIKTGSAILPYNIGVEVYNPKNGKRVFTTVTGLEKNRPLPASGVIYGLKTMSALHGGDESARIRVPVYQGDEGAEGKTAALFEYVSDVEITGDDIESYVPEGSVANLRIDIDKSEMMRVTCEFVATKQTVDKKLDTSRRQEAKSDGYLKEMLERTSARLQTMEHEFDDCTEMASMRERLTQIGEALEAGAQHKQVEQHLKEVMRGMEDLQEESEWDRAYRALRKTLMSLQIEAAKKSDDAGVQKMTAGFVVQVDRLEVTKDVRQAKFLRRQIHDYEYAITQDWHYRQIIRNSHENFHSIRWRDPEKAQVYVMQGMEILKRNPNAPLSETREVVDLMWDLMIHDNQGASYDAETGPQIYDKDIFSI